MDGNELLAFGGGEQQRFLAEDEDRRLLEKVDTDDGALRRNGAGAVGERGKRGA